MLLPLLAVLRCAAAAATEPFWAQHEPAAVYTSASLTLTGSGTGAPFFATASWINDPEFVGVFDTGTPDGSNDWTYAAPPGNDKQVPAWQVVQARHAGAAGVGRVDTFAALGTWFAPYECRVFAWSSAGGAAPAWAFSLPNCSSGAAALSMEADSVVAVSDDGSTAAFSGYAGGAPMLWVFDLQSGRQRFNATAPPECYGSGPVTLSATGAWAAWSASNLLLVYDGATGAQRGAPVKIGGGRCVVSDSGALVLARGEALAWSAAAGAYQQWRVFALPADGLEWSVQSIALGGDGTDAGALAAFGYFAVNDNERRARVALFSAASGALVADYTSPEAAQLQTDAVVRASGAYAAAALWGDADDFPTVVVIKAGAAAPLLAYVTPGSMFAVDIAVDAAAGNATHDAVFVVAAGKHVPANGMGDGGDAYAWRLDVEK